MIQWLRNDYYYYYYYFSAAAHPIYLDVPHYVALFVIRSPHNKEILFFFGK